ncbi:hypothetical protein [Acinetobacter modestus]|uniref:hypothetical protein n=1 Tax=Acinetobacter modestus TaxID=1776740 RepID=UPI003019DE32
MNTSTSYTHLVKLVKTLSTDDYIWLLHVINKDELEFNLRENIDDLNSELIYKDIDSFNTFHNIQEIKESVLNKCKNLNEREIFNIIDSINYYMESLIYRSLDLSNYKANPRLLNFTLYKLTKREDDSIQNIRTIKNKYIQFLYIISIYNTGNRIARKLDRIEKDFSQIMTNKPLHFKNNDTVEFYRWALKYMNEDKKIAREFDIKQYNPIQDNDFKITVLSILDQIYDTDENTYLVLKDKLSNAWYQKTYRKLNKGRKHHYFFTDKTFDCLKIIAEMNNTNEERTLDKLINEYFAQHCKYQNGESKYSL